jgi:hypothetical protein
LTKDAADQQKSIEKFAQADEIADSKDKGFAVYMHGAAYETLAATARTLGRSRAEQIELIKTGIRVNLEGQQKYPDYNYSISIDALFGKFKFVTGGVAVNEYLDEWLSYVKTQPIEKQGISSDALAAAFFDAGRDFEGALWAGRWIEYQKKLIEHPNLKPYKQPILDDACAPQGSMHLNFNSLRVRNPKLLKNLQEKYCDTLVPVK